QVPIKARAALHVGPILLRENSAADVALGAKPLEVDGIAKAVAARVMATAQGGQTLLTSEAGATLGDTPLKSHGYWRMKGIAAPLEVLEARAPDGELVEPLECANAYRVARSGDVWLPLREIKHRLPAERDAFVGRHDQLAVLARDLAGGGRLGSLPRRGRHGPT